MSYSHFVVISSAEMGGLPSHSAGEFGWRCYIGDPQGRQPGNFIPTNFVPHATFLTYTSPLLWGWSSGIVLRWPRNTPEPRLVASIYAAGRWNLLSRRQTQLNPLGICIVRNDFRGGRRAAGGGGPGRRRPWKIRAPEAAPLADGRDSDSTRNGGGLGIDLASRCRSRTARPLPLRAGI